MKKWEDFEIQCTDYLNKHFSEYAQFIHQGSTDSTVPDIQVIPHKNSNFYIEAKHCPAQCGQFVLLPNIETRKFEYSSQNSHKLNQYSQKIIDYMNKYFDDFREAGTAGKEIEITNGPDIFSKWIIQTYSDKSVKFFITNDYTIFPINDLNNYFYISAKYRIKRSGSNCVGKNCQKIVLDYIKNNYLITGYEISKDKLFISSSQNLHNKRFIILEHEYMFSLRENIYEIRKLSNTYNANVIFSIKLKASTKRFHNEDFINYLK